MEKKKKEDPKLRFWHGWMVDDSLDVRECEAIVSGPEAKPTVIGWSVLKSAPKDWSAPRDEYQFFETMELAEKAQEVRIAKFKEEMEAAIDTYHRTRERDYTSAHSLNEKVNEFLDFFGDGESYRHNYYKIRICTERMFGRIASFANSGSLTIKNISFRKEEVACLKRGGHRKLHSLFYYMECYNEVTIVLKSGIEIETDNEDDVVFLTIIFGRSINF